MEKKVLKIGQKVKLKPHCINIYGDYGRHTKDIGTAINYITGASLKWQIRWPDGEESSVKEEYVDIIVEDWDE